VNNKECDINLSTSQEAHKQWKPKVKTLFGEGLLKGTNYDIDRWCQIVTVKHIMLLLQSSKVRLCGTCAEKKNGKTFHEHKVQDKREVRRWDNHWWT